jgi:hypothetical protein
MGKAAATNKISLTEIESRRVTIVDNELCQIVRFFPDYVCCQQP